MSIEVLSPTLLLRLSVSTSLREWLRALHDLFAFDARIPAPNVALAIAQNTPVPSWRLQSLAWNEGEPLQVSCDDPQAQWLRTTQSVEAPCTNNATEALNAWENTLHRTGLTEQKTVAQRVLCTVQIPKLKHAPAPTVLAFWWNDPPQNEWVPTLPPLLTPAILFLASTLQRHQEAEQHEQETARALWQLRSHAENREIHALNHGLRVGLVARELTKILLEGTTSTRLSADCTLDRMQFAGTHLDLGKAFLPEEILIKRGTLTNDERATVQRHPSLAQPFLQLHPDGSKTLPWILAHHERWDGSGYPEKLAGDALSLEAQILGAADTFVAMTTDRAYRKAHADEAVMAYFSEQQGRAFSSIVVEAMQRLWNNASIDLLRARLEESNGPTEALLEHCKRGLARPQCTASTRIELLLAQTRALSLRARAPEAQHLLQALEALAPEDHRVALARAALAHDRGDAHETTEQAISQAIERSRGRASLHIHAAALQLQASLLRSSGSPAALDAFRHARRVAVLAGNEALVSTLTSAEAALEMTDGSIANAEQLFHQVQLRHTALGARAEAAMALGHRARAAFYQGRLEESAQWMDQSATLARAARAPVGVVLARNGRGSVLLHLHAFDAARNEFSLALQEASSLQNDWGQFYAHVGLCTVALAENNATEGSTHLRSVQHFADRLLAPNALQIATLYQALWTAHEHAQRNQPMEALRVLEDAYRALPSRGIHTTYEQALTLMRLRRLLARTPGLAASTDIAQTIEDRSREERVLSWLLAPGKGF